VEAAIKKILLRLFPELSAQLHLPRWGEVIALPELPTEEGERGSDPFYPRWAVDVQLLDENGTATKSKVLQAVPLPLMGAGDKAGHMQPPAIGSIVEIAFAYGRPDKPFIRTVLPYGFNLPPIKEGEARTQTKDGVYQQIDATGNFENKTPENLKDIIGKLAELQCQTRKVTASAEQDHRSPKTWLGSEGENVLKLLSELMATVKALATECAGHTHAGPPPDQAAAFTAKANEAQAQKDRLDPITK
jgi:hypothetical protein